MHRAEAEEGSAERAGAGRRLARVGIGADAEIAARAEAVELGGEAPGSARPAVNARGSQQRAGAAISVASLLCPPAATASR